MITEMVKYDRRKPLSFQMSTVTLTLSLECCQAVELLQWLEERNIARGGPAAATTGEEVKSTTDASTTPARGRKRRRRGKRGGQKHRVAVVRAAPVAEGEYSWRNPSAPASPATPDEGRSPHHKARRVLPGRRVREASTPRSD